MEVKTEILDGSGKTQFQDQTDKFDPKLTRDDILPWNIIILVWKACLVWLFWNIYPLSRLQGYSRTKICLKTLEKHVKTCLESKIIRIHRLRPILRLDILRTFAKNRIYFIVIQLNFSYRLESVTGKTWKTSSSRWKSKCWLHIVCNVKFSRF